VLSTRLLNLKNPLSSILTPLIPPSLLQAKDKDLRITDMRSSDPYVMIRYGVNHTTEYSPLPPSLPPFLPPSLPPSLPASLQAKDLRIADMRSSNFNVKIRHGVYRTTEYSPLSPSLPPSLPHSLPSYQAKDLRIADMRSSDPYVKIRYGVNQKFDTKVGEQEGGREGWRQGGNFSVWICVALILTSRSATA